MGQNPRNPENPENLSAPAIGFLEAGSVRLRPYEGRDASNFIDLVTDPSFGKFSPLPPLSKQEAEKAIRVIETNVDGKVTEFWTAEDKKTKEYAGFIGYNPVIYEKNTHELLYLGFAENYWKSLIPVESARLARDYAFSKNIQKIIAFVHPHDYATLRCFYNLPGKLEREEALFYGISVYMFSIMQ